MTKFILHGGVEEERVRDDTFFQEILKDTQREVKILLVYFAEPSEKVEIRIKQDEEQLNRHKGDKIINTKVAEEGTFIEDCKWADIIYLHGGRTYRLMGSLEKYNNLKQIFENKTVVGSSAGANVLCRFSYSKNPKDIKEVSEGLGILPYKILCHYKEGASNPFADIKPELETLFIREYETKVIYQ